MTDLTECRALAAAARDDDPCPIDGCPWRYPALSGPVLGDDGYATDEFFASMGDARLHFSTHATDEWVNQIGKLRGQLGQARSLRLEQPSAAVDPWMHTPERVRAYLVARGWHLVAEREAYDVWQHGHGQPSAAVIVPTKPGASDYAKRLGIALGDLARHYDTGELQVLTDIEAAGDA